MNQGYVIDSRATLVGVIQNVERAGTLACSADLDHEPQNAASDQCLHRFLKLREVKL